MQSTVDKIESVLRQQLSGEDGGDVFINETHVLPFHPEAVTFFCDDPSSSFKGHTKKPIFETNLLFSETDDDKKYRIERKDGVLIYTQFDVSSNGCSYAVGQAIQCEPGSDAESVFLARSLADIVEAAADPLIGLMKKARAAGLNLSLGPEQYLREQLFGASPLEDKAKPKLKARP